MSVIAMHYCIALCDDVGMLKHFVIMQRSPTWLSSTDLMTRGSNGRVQGVAERFHPTFGNSARVQDDFM